MIVTMITEDSVINVNGDRLTLPVTAALNEWAVQFNGVTAEVEYSDDTPNEVIDAAEFYARYQSDLNAHAAERAAIDAQAAIVTPEQLIAQLTGIRKALEAEGVTVNGIRYAGDPGERQSISESIQFMQDAGGTEFPIWKDFYGAFHANHPLADVIEAYRAIGVRRVQLIGAEGLFARQVLSGEITDVTGLAWP